MATGSASEDQALAVMLMLVHGSVIPRGVGRKLGIVAGTAVFGAVLLWEVGH